MAEQTQRHQVSLAVWDVPATVVAGERFTIRAGATSSAGCDLRGRRIEACDAAGRVLASGELGDTPWSGTAALVWTELALAAPTQQGMATLSVRLRGGDLDPPHRDGVARFSLMVTPPAAHTVTVEVLVKGSAAQLADAQVRLGAHRAVTAESGRTEVRLAKGRYNLHIWKVGFDAPPTALDLDSDITVRVEADVVPEENADRAWRA